MGSSGSAEGANVEFGRFFFFSLHHDWVPRLKATQLGRARGEGVARRIIPSHRFPFHTAAAMSRPDQPLDSGKHCIFQRHTLAGNRTIRCGLLLDKLRP